MTNDSKVLMRLVVRAKPHNMSDGKVKDCKVEARLGERTGEGMFPLLMATEFDEMDRPRMAAERFVEALEEAAKYFDLDPKNGFRYRPIGGQPTLTVGSKQVESTERSVAPEAQVARTTTYNGESRGVESRKSAPPPQASGGFLNLNQAVRKHLPEAFAKDARVTRKDLERVLQVLPWDQKAQEGTPVDMVSIGTMLKPMSSSTFALAVCALEFLSKVKVSRPRTPGKAWVLTMLEPGVTDEDVFVLEG